MIEFKGYSHGINLGGWLSQCDHTKERYDNFIHKEDIEKIASWGMDHIRVPIDYDLIEEKDGTYKEDGFTYIQNVIDWAGEYNLNMVLDVHKTFGYSFDDGENESGFFDSKEYQERFYKLWEEFSRRYAKYKDRLCFELLNEVTDEKYSDTWNSVAKTCIERIRAIAPDIDILVGGYHNNSVEALKDLLAPVDEHIVYNFHCYEPHSFTHQGAPWIPTMDTEFRMHVDEDYAAYREKTGKVIPWDVRKFDGYNDKDVFSADFFDKWLSEAVKISEERNVRLYCGEYGVIDRADPEDTLKWFEMICSVFDKYGIGRAAWSYKEMDFGIADARMDGVRDALLKLL